MFSPTRGGWKWRPHGHPLAHSLWNCMPFPWSWSRKELWEQKQQKDCLNKWYLWGPRFEDWRSGALYCLTQASRAEKGMCKSAEASGWPGSARLWCQCHSWGRSSPWGHPVYLHWQAISSCQGGLLHTGWKHPTSGFLSHLVKARHKFRTFS